MRVIKVVYTVEYSMQDLVLLGRLLGGYKEKVLPSLTKAEEAVLDAMYTGITHIFKLGGES